MLSSGFAHTPISRLLVFGLVISSFLASLTDAKLYFWIEVRPHLYDYHQFWRLLTWQLCYTNSTEVLFSAMTFYQLRVVERLWGSRKFASFLVSTFFYTTLIVPFLLAFVLRPLSFNRINYLPAGPTPLLFALLAQYHAAIPYIYKYRLSSSAPSAVNNASGASGSSSTGVMLTSKSTSYLLPAQLAFSQVPGSLLAASVGWVVGYALRREILPAKWRVPGWVLGALGVEQEKKERYNHLRRRMEGEAGRATGVEQRAEGTGEPARRRGVVGGLLEQFRMT